MNESRLKYCKRMIVNAKILINFFYFNDRPVYRSSTGPAASVPVFWSLGWSGTEQVVVLDRTGPKRSGPHHY